MPLKRDVAREIAQRLAAQGKSTDEIRVIIDGAGGVEPSAESSAQARKVIKTGISTVMDYPGQVARAGIVAPAMEAYTGKDLGVNFMDVVKQNQHAPGVGEMLKRSGMPEGSHLSDTMPFMFAKKGTNIPFVPEEGGALDGSQRAIIGGAADFGTDPWNWLSLGSAGALKNAAKGTGAMAKAATAAHVAINPMSRGLEKVGEGVYRAGILPTVMEGAKYGKDSTHTAKVLLDEGIWGRKIAPQMDELGEKLLTKTNAQLEAANAAGIEPSMARAMADPLAEAKRLRETRLPENIAAAENIEAHALDYTNLDRKASYTPVEKVPDKVSTIDLPLQGRAGPTGFTSEATGPFQFVEKGGYQRAAPTVPESRGVLPTEVSGFKTLEGNKVADAARNPFAVDAAEARRAKLFEGGLRNEERATVGEALGPEAQANFTRDRQDLGAILTTKEKQAAIEHTAASKPLISQTKAALSFLDPVAAAAMMAVQHGSQPALTGAGMLLNRAGRNIPEPVWRQILLQNEREGQYNK